MSLSQIFSVDPGAMLWNILVFLITLAVLGKFAWKPILRALEAREQGIADDIDKARSDRDAATEARRQMEEQLGQARTEAQGILEEGRSRARRLEEEQLIAAREEASQIRLRAEQEAELQSRQAMESLKGEVVDMTLRAAEQVIRQSLGPQDHEAIIRDTLKDMGGAS